MSESKDIDTAGLLTSTDAVDNRACLMEQGLLNTSYAVRVEAARFRQLARERDAAIVEVDRLREALAVSEKTLDLTRKAHATAMIHMCAAMGGALPVDRT